MFSVVCYFGPLEYFYHMLHTLSSRQFCRTLTFAIFTSLGLILLQIRFLFTFLFVIVLGFFICQWFCGAERGELVNLNT